MSKSDWRIFLSYRGSSEGKPFCERLFSYLTDDPFCKDKYGRVFFSPQSATLGHNFKQDVPEIMQTVEYFVIPLTRQYYDDFWDEEHDCPDDNSITFHEITAALKVKCRFICILFPGFEADPLLLKKLFKNQSDQLSCAILREYDPAHEEELMREISDSMVRNEYDVKGMADFVKNVTPNVSMSFKRDLEDTLRFPFYQLLYDVRKMTLLNYASSSFLTGIDIASIYQESDYLKRWFAYHLAKGNIEVDIVLTDPHSSAARDAALYKMYPDGLNKEKSEIILHNLNRLFEFKRQYPEAKLNVYLTRISLPYGVMITEHKSARNNYIKVDLYAAVTNDDRKRPSFYLLQQDGRTQNLYSFFEGNVKKIMQEHAFPFNGHPDIAWLLDKPIIHRGVIRHDLHPHTKRAYEACLDARHPIEVDLMQMRDGTIIVARDDQDLKPYGFGKCLSALGIRELRKINRQTGDDRILTFEEFLDMICGKIPILIEIKTQEKKMTPQLQNYVGRVVEMLQRYAERYSHPFNLERNTYGDGFAVHSTDPNVLRLIKTLDCMIPCGVITMDFEPLKDVVGEEFCKLHASTSYTQILTPDFISCDVNYLDNGIVSSLCGNLHIPLLAWTIKDADDQDFAFASHCDNIIIEGAKSHL